MEFNTKKYYPQLDALRAFAFLSVFFYHTIHPSKGVTPFGRFIYLVWSNLYLGLDIFFVLSAFLLTFLGINEYNKTGKFSFKNYFARRVLRIWPLYYLLMFFSFVILKYFKNQYAVQISLPEASWYLFFISNYYTKEHVFFLRILWTLSVEEQFYILWGFCLLFFQKSIVKVIVLFFTISLVFNFIGAYNKAAIALNTLSYLLDMMVGAYAAYALIYSKKIIKVVHKIKGIKQLLFYCFLPVLFFLYFLMKNLYGGSYNKILEEIVREIFIIYIGFVILHQMLFDKSSFSLSKNKFLIYTGKISFGLYCFHGIVISLFSIFLVKSNVHILIIFKMMLMLGITFGIASMSYYLFEKPFLKLKEKMR